MDFVSSGRAAENRTSWKGFVAKSSIVQVTLQDYGIEQKYTCIGENGNPQSDVIGWSRG